jgi:hypothetical protein
VVALLLEQAMRLLNRPPVGASLLAKT